MLKSKLFSAVCALGVGVIATTTAQAAVIEAYETNGYDFQYTKDGVDCVGQECAELSDSDSLVFQDTPSMASVYVDLRDHVKFKAPKIELNGSLNGDGTIEFVSGLINLDNTKWGWGTEIWNGLMKFTSDTGLRLGANSWSTAAKEFLIENGGIYGETHFVIDNGSVADGETKLVRMNDSLAFVDADGNPVDFQVADNNMYNIVYDDEARGITNINRYSISQKSQSEIAAAGYDDYQSGILKAMMSVSGNSAYDTIATLVQMGQSDAAKGLLNAMKPTTAPEQQLATEDSITAMNVAANRMSGMSGLGGSEDEEATLHLSPWIQGLFNHTNNNQNNGFRANSRGFALGVDSQVSEDWLLGAGFSRTLTHLTATNHNKTNMYGNNGFVYGQYKPADWYIRAIANYGRITYKSNGEHWRADTYAIQSMVGYVWDIFDASIGGRYIFLDNKGHTNQFGTFVENKDTSVGTAVVDLKVSKDFATDTGIVFTPSAHIAATYDVKAMDNTANIYLGGVSSYQVKGERLHRAGVEAGVGLIFKANNAELHLNYEGAFRKDNYSNTGMVKFKYNF